MQKSQWNNSRSKVHTVVNSAGRVAHVRAMNVVDQHESVEEVSTQSTGKNWKSWMTGKDNGGKVSTKEWTSWHETKEDAEREVQKMWEKSGWTVWNVVVK